MVEQSENFKVLEMENAELRDKLQKLSIESEKSGAAVLESSKMETVRLEKLLALRDKQLDDLKKDFDSQRDRAHATEKEMKSFREERAQWNHSVLGNISDFRYSIDFLTFFHVKFCYLVLSQTFEPFRLSYLRTSPRAHKARRRYFVRVPPDS